MTGRELLQVLADRGVRVRLADGVLQAGPAPVPPDVRLLIAGHRLELVEALVPPPLAERIRRMAARWNYTRDDLESVLIRAAQDPAGWTAAVAHDESMEARFRETGALPRASA